MSVRILVILRNVDFLRTYAVTTHQERVSVISIKPKFEIKRKGKNNGKKKR